MSEATYEEDTRPGLGDMEIDRASREEVFEAARTPTVEELLREKRLRS